MDDLDRLYNAGHIDDPTQLRGFYRSLQATQELFRKASLERQLNSKDEGLDELLALVPRILEKQQQFLVALNFELSKKMIARLAESLGVEQLPPMSIQSLFPDNDKPRED